MNSDDGEMLAYVDDVYDRLHKALNAEVEPDDEPAPDPMIGKMFYKGHDGDDDAGEPTPHARTKARHHEKLAELAGAMADHHKKMAAHYSAGAAGAHTVADEEAEPQKDADDIGLAVLKARAINGDDIARLRLNELGKQAVRHALRDPQVALGPGGIGFRKARGG